MEDKTPQDVDNDENNIVDIEEQIMQSGTKQQETVSDQNSKKAKVQEEISRLQKELEEKIEENKKLESHHLRALADYENLSKRTKAERLKLLKSANADLITKFLGLADSLKKGTDSFSESSVTLDVVKEGFKAVESQFFNILKNEGIEQITSLGEKFDPSLHEVVLVRSDSSVEEDTILEEIQVGYKLNSFLLRPSKVIIAKK
ncbi:MAG: nucleotide exchange factor GrpE [Candidatus Heimdallarchaeota archaeon]|nr:nucleotide exchange factor GrpE [Candidatus Heimdallarchaeota archaeon]